ncbi:damage-control phosphatase ARMT1-like [Apostichopus japonicus]|uniref:damage-control phosphatase ARMT1-like n=1 Tax=Stichopus japonicus TaxID=307972 RepID=UPI003AB9039A
MESNLMPERLSAKKKGTFAFKTIADRLPTILTKVIDTTYQYRLKAAELYGEEGANDCKALAGHLSKLRNCLQTDKPLEEIGDGRDDEEMWNKVLREETETRDGVPPSAFTASWLYVECYMYRSVNEGIRKSQHLRDFDPFRNQKEQALETSRDALITLSLHLQETLKKGAANFESFSEVIQISLWGNKCDLSISAGVENSQKISPVEPLQRLRPYILVNHVEQVWKLLQSHSNKPLRLDIILDNAGFELFTDLCLADFMMSTSLVTSVHLHYKAMPWFVSDVTASDFHWTLKQLSDSEDKLLSSFGNKWRDYLKNGRWIVHDHPFWTTCHDFSEMKSVSPDLYQELTHSDLIFLKGDLNYRKLVGDREWSHTEPYERALGGFNPAPHCALRTLKADVVVGLQKGVDTKIEARNPEWMVSGEYAVIQFSAK